MLFAAAPQTSLLHPQLHWAWSIRILISSSNKSVSDRKVATASCLLQFKQQNARMYSQSSAPIQRSHLIAKAILLLSKGGHYSEKSYKREFQEKNLPFGSMPVYFCLGIQPNCLNGHSNAGSGLAQAGCPAVLSPRGRRYASSSLWFHFAVVTAPNRFRKHNKPDSCPLDEWQHMVLLETRGLWLCSIVREGIGLIRRLACLGHGPDFGD